MQVCRTIPEIKAVVREAKAGGSLVGLVPTMGFFHAGHLSLMHAARRECDLVVVSLFVNPTQFGPNEDFAEYPRDFDRDKELATKEGVDVIFAPAVEEMYPPGYQTYVEVEEITRPLCGKARPGHFRGVTTVVTKLFNIVEPDRAYFGQKDAQQALVIQQMVRDLNMNVDIKVLPIVREKDGLAMSSRNVYLNPREREAATVLFRSLQLAEDKIRGGERDPARLRGEIMPTIESEPLANLEYAEILSIPGLKPLNTLQGKILIALAVRIGKTRLIDNTIVEVP